MWHKALWWGNFARRRSCIYLSSNLRWRHQLLPQIACCIANLHLTIPGLLLLHWWNKLVITPAVMINVIVWKAVFSQTFPLRSHQVLVLSSCFSVDPYALFWSTLIIQCWVFAASFPAASSLFCHIMLCRPTLSMKTQLKIHCKHRKLSEAHAVAQQCADIRGWKEWCLPEKSHQCVV